MSATIEYEIDMSDVEPDMNDYQWDMEFLQKLPKQEIIPGINKYSMKVPKDVPVVESDSRLRVMKWHRDRNGEEVKKMFSLNGFKYKLASVKNEEILDCLRTMRENEISYFEINREELDKQDPDHTKLTESELKDLLKTKQPDGFIRISLEEEEKIKKNIKGVTPTLEISLEEIKGCKNTGNEYFKQLNYEKSAKEYMRGFNLISCFPRKKAIEEKKEEIVTELDILRRNLVNNGLKALYKLKIDQYKIGDKLFDQNITKEFHSDPKYVYSLSQIWVKLTENGNELDVSDMILYLEAFVNMDSIPEEDKALVSINITKLKKYERSYNALGGLRTFLEKSSEFERDQKIMDKIRQRNQEEELLRTQENLDNMMEEDDAQEEI